MPDLADTIARLQAFQEAGADVLYAPGLRSLDDIRSVITSVDRPVNALALPNSLPLSLEELARADVKRLSLGPLLSNTAYGALTHAARELLNEGTFGFAQGAVSASDLEVLMSRA